MPFKKGNKAASLKKLSKATLERRARAAKKKKAGAQMLQL